jgi:predicted glycosyl hydrolase (DUF1957 family)
MSLTPTLCAMLQDELLRDRYARHLDLLIDLTAREQNELANDRSCMNSLASTFNDSARLVHFSLMNEA